MQGLNPLVVDVGSPPIPQVQEWGRTCIEIPGPMLFQLGAELADGDRVATPPVDVADRYHEDLNKVVVMSSPDAAMTMGTTT